MRVALWLATVRHPPAGTLLGVIRGPEPIHDRTPALLTIEQGLEWPDLNGPGKMGFAEPVCAGTYSIKHVPRDQVMSAELRPLI